MLVKEQKKKCEKIHLRQRESWNHGEKYVSLRWRGCKQTACFCPTHIAFLEGGAKRPACQWQERPLGRREPRESTETSGGRGSDPPRRLRLRKGELFFGLQRTVPPQILSFRFFTAPASSPIPDDGSFHIPSEKADWGNAESRKPAFSGTIFDSAFSMGAAAPQPNPSKSCSDREFEKKETLQSACSTACGLERFIIC